MELILVRHGLPEREERVRGPADPPLSRLGREQAQLVGAWLATQRIDAVYTSPLRRAVETARPLERELGLPATVSEDIVEYDRDASTYIPMEQLKAEDYPAWQAFVAGGYGDDVDMAGFQRQVARGMEAIIAGHAGQRVAVFCHGGVVNVWATTVLGMAPRLFVDVGYASVSRFLCASTGERNILSLNETQHLAKVVA